jgi:alkanesulfonate monooxygenase SsuD/methylene tetrahydromethanopterin reductase-like flavin-dependent oxidoreductase (luciferase family)
MLLMALAMRTTRLRLGTAVTVLPWQNPVLLAEQAATLDLLSGGRLDFGIGKGYRHNEFAGFGISQEEAEARFEEALAVITRSWLSRTRFSHHGRFWTFEDIVVEPPPAQQPHPPLWVAAGNPASILRAAARGFNLILDQYASPEAIAERISIYSAERKANDFAFNPMQVAVARHLYVAKDDADTGAALARLAQFNARTVAVSRTPGGKTGSHVLAYADNTGATEAYALFGTPDEVNRKLDAIRKAGAEYVLLVVSGGIDQLRRFKRDIMPNFSTLPTESGAMRVAENKA